jgi:hypothetical protein
MHTFSHGEHHENVRQACAWMESQGVKFSRGRIAQYLRGCRIVAEHDAPGSSLKTLGKAEYRRLVNSLIESQEIVDIWKGLKDGADASLLEELPGISFGKRDETDMAQGRSRKCRAFSLYVKTLLARAGYVFGTHPTCDIVLAETPEIMIECKQASSESGFEKAVSQGKRQLRAHYADDPNRRGFLAISVTGFPGDEGEIEAATEQEASEKADERLLELYERLVQFVDRIEEPQTWGVVLFMLTPVHLDSKLIIQENFLIDPVWEEARPFAEDLSGRLKNLIGS